MLLTGFTSVDHCFFFIYYLFIFLLLSALLQSKVRQSSYWFQHESP